MQRSEWLLIHKILYINFSFNIFQISISKWNINILVFYKHQVLMNLILLNLVEISFAILKRLMSFNHKWIYSLTILQVSEKWQKMQNRTKINQQTNRIQEKNRTEKLIQNSNKKESQEIVILEYLYSVSIKKWKVKHCMINPAEVTADSRETNKFFS